MRLRDVFLATCVVLLTLGAAYMLINLAHLLIVLFVAIIFASTVRPLLHGLRRARRAAVGGYFAHLQRHGTRRYRPDYSCDSAAGSSDHGYVAE